MNLLSHIHRTLFSGRQGLGVFAMLLLAGCGREDIRVYTVPKEKPAPPRLAHKSGAAKPRPQLGWKLPQGWKETGPGEMSLAGFSIAGSGSQEAQVTITPLTVLSGRETQIVNMWREQVGLNPLSEEEVTRQFQPVEVGGEQGSLFEVTGKAKDAAEPVRILTAMVHRPGASWFYKLSGNASLVEAQKETFIAFLKSIQIKEAAPADAGSAGTPPKPNWQVPSQWKEVPAGQFLVAKFTVAGEAGAQASVNVSRSTGAGGGLVPNVNRWRVQQLQLPPVEEAELSKLSTSVDIAGGKATFVDFTGTDVRTGQPARIVGAMVAQASQTWFYKLMGDLKIVESQKDAFTKFIETVKY